MNDKNKTDLQDEMIAEKAKDAKGTGLRIIKQLLEQKWKILLVFLSVLLASASNLLAPKVIGNGINVIVEGVKNAAISGELFLVNWESLGMIVVILITLYVLNFIFNYIQQYVMASVSQTLTLSLRKKISEKLNKLPAKFFDTHKKGDILSRVTSDLERVSDSLQEGLTQLFSSIIGIVGAFAMMIWISVPLTAIVLLTIILSFIVSIFVSKHTQDAYSKNQKSLGNLNAHIEEAFTGNTVIKSYRLEEQTIQKAYELNEELFQAGKNAQFITYIINPIIRLVNQIGYVVIAIRGAVSVINGTITLGDIQAFFQYVNQVSEPITQVAYITNMFQGAIASAERVYEILDEIEEADLKENTLPKKIEGNISFENVHFGYTKTQMLMENINLDIKAGSKIAIVGPTGAGKTTLVNLLMRFYELNNGKISIDGIDISKISRKSLHSVIGMVLQDTWLFEGTIKENISYGKKGATDAQIIKASKASRVDHFIRTMSKGYDTILNNDASNISQGQRQLLTIARAILADPAILILDEATSSVDTRTEIEIQKAMNNLMKGRTTFIIAHRLSTIVDADLILVMENGTIVEKGAHHELLMANGAYAELYNSQFA